MDGIMVFKEYETPYNCLVPSLFQQLLKNVLHTVNFNLFKMV